MIWAFLAPTPAELLLFRAWQEGNSIGTTMVWHNLSFHSQIWSNNNVVILSISPLSGLFIIVLGYSHTMEYIPISSTLNSNRNRYWDHRVSACMFHRSLQNEHYFRFLQNEDYSAYSPGALCNISGMYTSFYAETYTFSIFFWLND